MKIEHFKTRHIGIKTEDLKTMLQTVGVESVDQLIDETIPKDIRLKQPLDLPKALTEMEYADEINRLASARGSMCFFSVYNKAMMFYIGLPL